MQQCRLEQGRRWRVGREGTLVLTVVAEDGARREGVSLLDDIVREGARRMLTAALEAEVDAYLAELASERDERGRRLVVRNGHAQPRQVLTGAGRRWCGRGGRTAGQRQARRPGQRWAAAVPVGDPAAVVSQEPEGGRGVAAAVPARPVDRGLRARAGAVPRLGRGAVRGGDHPTGRAVDRRLPRLAPAGP